MTRKPWIAKRDQLSTFKLKNKHKKRNYQSYLKLIDSDFLENDSSFDISKLRIKSFNSSYKQDLNNNNLIKERLNSINSFLINNESFLNEHSSNKQASYKSNFQI